MRTWVLVGLFMAASSGAAMAQDAAAGEAAFKKYVCFACHDIGEGAKIKLGPPLNGIDGRHSGSFPKYPYSDGMKNLNITWNEANFKKFIVDPSAMVEGTKMTFAGIKDPTDVDSVWLYLKQFDAEGNKK